MTRLRQRVVAMGVLGIALAACRIPSPLTYPLMLTPPVDATTEVQQLLGDPPAPAATPGEVAQQLAVKLTRQMEGCEVLTIAQVIWVAPTEPATAAIEARGLCDDSVSGVWYEITIVPNVELGWVTTATRQEICARGVSGELCV